MSRAVVVVWQATAIGQARELNLLAGAGILLAAHPGRDTVRLISKEEAQVVSRVVARLAILGFRCT